MSGRISKPAPPRRHFTSPQQILLLIEFMENNGDIGKERQGGAQSKAKALERWKELTLMLNSCGMGGSRDLKKWQKVWADTKYKTKAKAIKKKRDLERTGGGPADVEGELTDTDLRVIEIMGETAVYGLGQIAEAGFGQLHPEIQPPEVQPPEVASEVVLPVSSGSITVSAGTRRIRRVIPVRRGPPRRAAQCLPPMLRQRQPTNLEKALQELKELQAQKEAQTERRHREMVTLLENLTDSIKKLSD